MITYKRHTIVDGRLGWIVVDRNEAVINKYPSKDDLKDLQTEPYFMNMKNRSKKYTDDEWLNYLKIFYEKNGRIPVRTDFINSSEYPHYQNYTRRFGSWNNTLKLAGLDSDAMIKREKLEAINQNCRQFENVAGNMLGNKSIDLSGENIKEIRKDAIAGIKEKIKKNPGYLYSCNEERQEDMKRLKFSSGNDFINWMGRAGIIKSSADVNREALEKKIKNANCENIKEYQNKCARNAGFKDRNEKVREWKHKTGRCLPKEFNEDCSIHFGDFTENLMIQTFEDPIKMRHGNPGFDWICKEGYKIDNKGACLVYRECTSYFEFPIRCNNIADVFILSCWDNRDSLNPLNIFVFYKNDIVKGRKFYKFESFIITNTPKKLKELEKWEVTDRLYKLKEICNRLKEENEIQKHG